MLVVDDQPTFEDAAHQLLERRGYAVVAEAGCATTALEAVERFAPEAVLLDVRLGNDDGFEVCLRLTRARPGLAVLLVKPTREEAEQQYFAQADRRHGAESRPFDSTGMGP